MSGPALLLAEAAAHLLEREERDAVLGDLAESGKPALSAAFDVGGLVLRRQAALWKSWQPWLAGFGLALPGSFLLMGLSVSASLHYEALAWIVRNHPFMDLRLLRETDLTVGPGVWLLSCQLLLLIGVSWTAGFVVSSLSRRTLWVSAALCFGPCLFCMERFRIPGNCSAILLLFVLPAAWGVWRGSRAVRIRLRSAVLLALMVTALMVYVWSCTGFFPANGLLAWPAWYLVATAQQPRYSSEGANEERPEMGVL